MYYLRKEPHEGTTQEIKKTNGDIIPERKYTIEDRAVYKDTRFTRFYRQTFRGFDQISKNGTRLYTCKTLKRIMELRQATFHYSQEWFDVYDENGKVELEV